MTTRSKTAAGKPRAGFSFVVLLYPTSGGPRVGEVPAWPKGCGPAPVQTFKTRAKAEAALEKFLTEHPEYRRWNEGGDGRGLLPLDRGGAA